MEEITFNEIISYAKIAEENAKSFYLNAAEEMEQRNVKEYLETLAAEEQTHINRLEALQKTIQSRGEVPDLHSEIRSLGYADFIKAAELGKDASYKDVLVVAMSNEKEAIRNYDNFSRFIDNEEAKKLFTVLADEERRHLKRFEEEYDELQDQNY
ncbi:MAG: ferritin family protein [Deltaproteobacteria bacterium]|nr:ferritin family protein [Deltaproteobacteria bacterium]